jgi:hypothetical protein
LANLWVEQKKKKKVFFYFRVRPYNSVVWTKPVTVYHNFRLNDFIF